MILGINALRAKSGGGIIHLKSILAHANPIDYGFEKIHLWSYEELMNQIPDYPWLIKHIPSVSKRSILSQLIYQFFSLKKEVKSKKCNILYNVDASSFCNYDLSVVMSRDMLSYEPGEMKRYGFSYSRLRLQILKIIQNYAFKKSSGVIFLTEYAAKNIQLITNNLSNWKVIPHGIDDKFRSSSRNLSINNNQKIKALYVSNIAPYKHQWKVIEAISILRNSGIDIELILTMGGNASGASIAQKYLDKSLDCFDPKREFVKILGFIPHDDLPILYAKADIFIFASSCENMPNTLLEAMASGLPIACSERGPMPEVLKDGGSYFNPENAISIAESVKKNVIRHRIYKWLKYAIK